MQWQQHAVESSVDPLFGSRISAYRWIWLWSCRYSLCPRNSSKQRNALASFLSGIASADWGRREECEQGVSGDPRPLQGRRLHHATECNVQASLLRHRSTLRCLLGPLYGGPSICHRYPRSRPRTVSRTLEMVKISINVVEIASSTYRKPHKALAHVVMEWTIGSCYCENSTL